MLDLRVRKRFVLLAAIIAGGLALRLHMLGSESIWLDESTSIVVASMAPTEMLRWLVAWDVQPPAYFLLLHYWLGLGDGEYMVRLLSVAVGTLSIVAIYQLANLLFDVETALYAAFLLAISPLHIQFSQETRSYALLTLVGIVSSYLLVQVLRRGQVIHWIAYLIVALLGMYTHYFFAFVLLSHNLFALISCLDRREWHKLGCWMVLQVLVVAAFTPFFLAWLPSLRQEMASTIRFSSPPPGLKALVMTFMDFGIGTTIGEREVRFLGYSLISILVTYVLWRVWQDLHRGPRSYRPGSALYCALYLAIPVLSLWGISQVKTVYLSRYLLQALPGLLLLFALGIVYARRSHLKFALVALLALVSAFSLRGYFEGGLKEDWRGLARFVIERRQPGDVIVFGPSWYYKPFDYYSRGAVELYTDLPLEVDSGNVEESLKPVMSGHKRLWLVRMLAFSEHYGEIGAYLDARFPLVDKARFQGIGEVVLYDIEMGALPYSTSRMPAFALENVWGMV